MDFEEYWKNGCFGEYHDIYAKNLADQFYNAGQQSKQAEIDKVKELLNQWDNWISVSANHNCIEIVKECADELRGLLK